MGVDYGGAVLFARGPTLNIGGEMKTKDLIKELQEADPSGELHVMDLRGAIHFVDCQPGYHNGPCHYVEKSIHYPSKYYIVDKKDKVVIHGVDLDDFIWGHDGKTDKIIVDLHSTTTAEHYNKRIQDIAAEAKLFHTKSGYEFIVRLLEALKKGDRIMHDKLKENDRITCNSSYFLSKDGEKNRLCQGETAALIESSLFELDKEKLEWFLTLKEEK